MSKIVLFLLSFTALAIVFGAGYEVIDREILKAGVWENKIEKADVFIANNEDDKNNETLGNDPVTMMFVGDVMLDREVAYKVGKYLKNDWKAPFANCIDTFKRADLLLGNLESPISDKGYKVGSIYSFRAKPETMEALTYAGFDAMSFANNHIFDYTRTAFEDTISRLNEAGIKAVGAGMNLDDALAPRVLKVKGLKVAFVGFSELGFASCYANESRSGVAFLNDENVIKAVRTAKAAGDIAVISFHFGNEYQKMPSVSQKHFAKLAIDNGADLVIGHHPHVTQPVEQYKNGWIAYSLGNFLFDQYFSEQTMKGLLLEVKVDDGKIKDVLPHNMKMNSYYQPQIID